MAEQLHFWGEQGRFKDGYIEAVVEYPPSPEPSPDPPAERTTLDRDLELLYLDYLGQSAQRIASAVERRQNDRRAEFIRMINYEVAVGKLSREQSDLLLNIVWGRHRYC